MHCDPSFAKPLLAEVLLLICNWHKHYKCLQIENFSYTFVL